MKDYSNYTAYAIGNGYEITVTYLYECGWAIEVNESSWDEYSSIIDTMKRFKELAKQYGIKTVMIPRSYLDVEGLKQWDRDRAEYDRQEEHYNAYLMWESTGDRSALDRYERRYE